MSARKEPKAVFAVWNGQSHDMTYVPNPKARFNFACMRVRDNAGTGHVVEGDTVYSISPASRLAKLVKDESERVAVIAIVRGRTI